MPRASAPKTEDPGTPEVQTEDQTPDGVEALTPEAAAMALPEGFEVGQATSGAYVDPAHVTVAVSFLPTLAVKQPLWLPGYRASSSLARNAGDDYRAPVAEGLIAAGYDPDSVAVGSTTREVQINPDGTVIHIQRASDRVKDLPSQWQTGLRIKQPLTVTPLAATPEDQGGDPV